MDAEPSLAPGDYRLSLDVNFGKLTWDGAVLLQPAPGATDIALDLEGLTVRGVRRAGHPVPFHHEPRENLLSIPLPGGTDGPLSVEFSGVVDRKSLVGLYRSKHGSEYVLTTQCEPTGARRIFPCIDRPDRKGRILLTLRTEAGLDVVANTEGRSSSLPDGRTEWTFAATPPMATYLFYLGIGRFERAEERPGRVAVRVFTPPGRAISGGYAAEAGGRILQACERYYGIPYPLGKLDLLAVEEHAFGAMENWGAISFQALRLLVDERSTSFATRDVFETISHEVAHQWFGNLVTMSWWNDVWLNESFAALMETKITEQLEPSLDARADFFLRVAGMAAAVAGDSLRSTHPVRVAVERPEEISQIFDEISYGKGASVLAMLESYLGEETFRAGVTEYLTRFRYGNACTEDLWAALERASGEPVAAMAAPWIDRPGLPLIRASMTPRGLELTQGRFGYLPPPEEPPWPIPLVIDVDGRRERVRLDTRTQTVAVPPTAHVHLNPGATGFYRVLYDRTLSDRLLADLPRRPAADRWIVLEDLAAFLFSGEIDWETYARFVRALADTPDRLIVESLVATLADLALGLPRTAVVQALARDVLARAYARLGPERRPGEPSSDRILRDRVSFARVRVDREFAEELQERFRDWERLDPDLRASVAVARARAGGEEGFRELRRAFDRPLPEVEASRLGQALVWSSDPALVREALEFGVTGGVNRNRLMYLVTHASANPAGHATVWPWFIERIQTLDEIFRGSGYLPLTLERSIPYLAYGRGEEVRAYFRGHTFPEGVRGVAKGLERAEIMERTERRLAGTSPA